MALRAPRAPGKVAPTSARRAGSDTGAGGTGRSGTGGNDTARTGSLGRAPGPRRAIALALFAALVASPWFGIPSWGTEVAATAIFTGIAATGVSMMLGQAGLLTLGAAFFFGIGGYGAALTTHYSSIPIVPAILLSAVASVAVAVPLGLLLVRLPRFYFAVASLGLAIALAGVIAALPNVTGGASGLPGGGSLGFGLFSVAAPVAWYVTALVALALVLGLVRLMTRGRRYGAYALLRQDELAASGLGIPVLWMKVQMFAAAAGVLAFGGGLLFALQRVVVPDNAGVTQSVQLIGIAVVGGMTSELGGVVGASVLIWLQSLLSGFATVELLIYGAVFLAVVMIFSDGLVGLVKLGWRLLWGLPSRGRPRRGRAEALPAAAGAPPGTPGARAAAEATPAGPLTGGPGDPEAATLEIDGVRRAFGGVIAVDDVSMVVPAGSVTALIGHNGAGKSTLLNIVSGFELADAGAVRLGGAPIDRLPPERRAHLGLSRSFQSPRLIDDVDVLENVILGAEFSGAARRRHGGAGGHDRRAASFEALELLGLGSIAGQLAGTLSGGHRKQVELARALVARPTVLILDEPGVGLDSSDIAKVAAVIRAAAGAGAAVLVVDHNIDFVESIADSVFSMELGRVSPLAPPPALASMRKGARP